MKIAIVHSFYSSNTPSGENSVVNIQLETLRKAGHQVELVSQSTDSRQRAILYKIKSALVVASGYGPNPLKILRKFQPDLVLIHNMFPNIGSNWMKSWNGPLIQVIHNYRHFCANGIFFRDNQICFDCMEKSPIEALKHSCYRDSLLATLPLFIAQKRRNWISIEKESIDKYIVLSDMTKKLLGTFGIEKAKIATVPNFTDDFTLTRLETSTSRQMRKGWVAVGRLTNEKGFASLIRNWPDPHKLDIIGNGPELEALKILTKERPNIRLLGSLPKNELFSTLDTYQGAIFPSIWVEVAPLAFIEFLCAGLPVITLNVNATASIVENNGAGIVLNSFNPGSLTKSIEIIESNHEEFSKNARACYESEFTSEAWLKRMHKIFAEVVKF